MSSKDFALAKKVLYEGKVIAFPTETVMGLGVVFDNREAYDSLNEIKRRPEDKPYTLMVADKSDFDKYAYLSYRDRQIINAFVPGPVTLLLKAKENIPNYVTHGTGIIGIRCPDMEIIRELIKEVDKPLLVPSANRSGEKPLKTYKEVIDTFKDEISYVLEIDALGMSPSTIVDLTGETIKIVREGPISREDIERKMHKMKIAVGSDHGGLDYKNKIKEHLEAQGHQVVDVGTYTLDSCHYPLYGAEVAKKVASKECDYGVVVCTSGEGISMAANKIKGVRCGIAYNDEVARLMRAHNNANVIAFGARFISLEDAIKRVEIFLNTNFEGGRHQTRIEMIDED